MKTLQRKNYLSIALLCVILLNEATTVTGDEVVCKSAIIRSIKDFNVLQNCSVVAGYIQIVEIIINPAVLSKVIPSNIEEISEYLLVYHVEGLDSLERLFPKLVIIRGTELIYDQYALVILENRDLKNIGLISLLRVLRGSIRVESNPLLCFTYTINWVSILGNNTKQYNYILKNNKSPNECPLCYTYQDELDTIDVNRHKKCWSVGKFQRTPFDSIGGKQCSQQGERGNCLTSCSDTNCHHCTNYVSDKGCVDNCLPRNRLIFKRQCTTDCTWWGYMQLGMECVDKCPRHHREIRKNNKIVCSLNCNGDIVVNDLEDLEGLADCTIIQGSLTIELNEKSKPLITNLEQTFANLNEITGFLKIVNSPQIVSLHFFKNLHTIKGRELIDDLYALYVVDNQYLEELWLQNVAILHGCVYFHLNPRLCYNKITDLQKGFKECTRLTVKDASRNSNGERVVCGDDVRAVNATIIDFNSTAALVEVDLMMYDDVLLLIGYVYYYKETPDRNVTKFDGRHGCGLDSWFTDVVVTQRRRHILSNLKPGTQYAYFVKSMNTMDYPYLAEYVSEVKYFQTEPAKPGPIAKMYVHALSPEEIEIHWWPPRQPNGIIDKYILQYEITDESITPTPDNELKEMCQCPKLDIESHIPTPHTDDYYDKEQFIYKDALSNFLFQKGNYIYTRKNTTTIADAEARAALIIKHLEEKAVQKQEEGKEMYYILHPHPVCNQSHPDAQNQMQNNCIPLEVFEKAIEIPSHRHSYILINLEPEKTYRISLRACVKDLVNGCGAEKVIFAETVSKKLETLLENLTIYKW